MKINRYNYEVFLVDYLDGTLDPSLNRDFIVFLEQNPDLKNQFDGLEDVVLAKDIVIYPNKADLKKKSFLKDGVENESEYLCIASIEGEISGEEKVKLNSILKENQTIISDLLLYQKTIIHPSKSIIFPNKTRLKRTSIISIRYSTLKKSIGIAASIGLLLSVYTIGKILVNSNHPHELNKNDVVASVDQSLINSKKELYKIDQSSSTKPFDFVSSKKNTQTSTESNELGEDINNQTIRKKQPIPIKLLSIDSREILGPRKLQDEVIVGLIESYPRHKNPSAIEIKGYADNTTNKYSVKEIGFFEILQYGVHSFGRLRGKDIRLNAKKNKNGSIEKISFESSLIAFSTPIRKKQ